MILINAQDNRTEKLGPFSRYVPLAVPVGIGTLAAYLASKGHKVKIWDDAIRSLSPDDISGLIHGMEKPYIFGISCLTASITRGHTLAKFIKAMLPDAFIVLGGIHPTVLPEDSLNTGFVDFVIRKEGEIPLELLCRCLKDGKDYEGIPGLSFRKNGTIIHNQALSNLDIDSLPPFPYGLFEAHADKYNFGFVLSSRGCPYNCIFCSQRSVTGRRIIYRDPEKVASDIELLVDRYGQKLITFIDDNMLTDKTRIKALCAQIRKRGLQKKTTFQCQVRGDDINEDILRSLKAANFITLDFGLETASERLMLIIDKRETVERNIQALELAKKHGFKLSGTFILGLPTESKEERFQAYALARRHLDYVRFNNATPYPGTRLYEMAKQENRLNVGKDWQNLNACATLVGGPFSRKQLAYVPSGTTETELKTDILKYNLFFSFRPGVVAGLLRRKSGTAGWFKMPARWFTDIKEWLHLARLGFYILQSFLGLFILLFTANLEKVKVHLQRNKK